MAKHSESEDWEQRKEQIVGLGERSFRKSYYPQLRENLDRLERFRVLLDRATDIVVMLSVPDGIVVDANGALGQLLGCPADTLIGRPLASLGLGCAGPNAQARAAPCSSTAAPTQGLRESQPESVGQEYGMAGTSMASGFLGMVIK